MIRYFAYGSNMDPNRIKERLGYLPDSTCGILDGYRLMFNKISMNRSGVGWANIEIDLEEKVEGVIYFITDRDFEVLDGYEGVYGNHYKRLTVEIRSHMKDNDAVTYIACEGMIGQNLKPTESYLESLKKGKKCLSEKYYEKLEATETY